MFPKNINAGVADLRIEAGTELYKAGKKDWLVVSGGDYRNLENGYDEPFAMRDSLMKQGIDSARIIFQLLKFDELGNDVQSQ